ncbi:hypothetical protein ABTX80_32375 [Streptomyces erythrochromogenes]|uniref:hypothetical protein n=1 Tax=Streptomyces erythrochromogenes TaxID=285574 RepID=UPI003329020F
MDNTLAVAGGLWPGQSLAFEPLEVPAAEQDAWTKTFCVFCMGTCMKAKTDVPPRRERRT